MLTPRDRRAKENWPHPTRDKEWKWVKIGLAVTFTPIAVFTLLVFLQ